LGSTVRLLHSRDVCRWRWWGMLVVLMEALFVVLIRLLHCLGGWPEGRRVLGERSTCGTMRWGRNDLW